MKTKMNSVSDCLKSMSKAEQKCWLRDIIHVHIRHKKKRLKKILTDYEYLDAKIAFFGFFALLEDFEKALEVNQDEVLVTLKQALERARTVIEEEPLQLPGQLWKTLQGSTLPPIQDLLQQSLKAPFCWLRVIKSPLLNSRDPLIRTLRGGKAWDWATSLVMTPDNSKLIACRGNKIFIYDWHRGTLSHEINAHQERIITSALSPDGKRLATVSHDTWVKIWNLENGASLLDAFPAPWNKDLPSRSPLPEFLTSTRFLDLMLWKPPGEPDPTTWVENPYFKRNPKRFSAGNSNVPTCVEFFSDNHRIAIGFMDTSVVIYDLKTKQNLYTLYSSCSAAVHHIAISQDDSILIYDSFRSNSTSTRFFLIPDVCNLKNLEFAKSIEGDFLRGEGLVWDNRKETFLEYLNIIETFKRFGIHQNFPTLSEFLASSINGTEKVDEKVDEEENYFEEDQSLHDFGIFREKDDVLFLREDNQHLPMGLSTKLVSQERMAFFPDGQRLFMGNPCYEGLVIWNLITNKFTHFAKHSGGVSAIAISPDTDKIISGGMDGIIRVWDTQSGVELATMLRHGGPVLSIAVTPDNQHLISGGTDGTIKIWDLNYRNNTQEVKISPHSSTVSSLSLFPDGKHAISVAEDGTAAVWNIGTQSIVWQFSFNRELYCPATVAIDNHRFAISTIGGCDVYNLETREIDYKFVSKDYWRSSILAISPDGKYLLGSSQIRHLAVWRIPTKKIRFFIKLRKKLRNLLKDCQNFLLRYLRRFRLLRNIRYSHYRQSNPNVCIYPVSSGFYGYRHGAFGYTESINAIAISPDNHHVAFAMNLTRGNGLQSISLGIRIGNLKKYKFLRTFYDNSVQKYLNALVQMIHQQKDGFDDSMFDIEPGERFQGLEPPIIPRSMQLPKINYFPDYFPTSLSAHLHKRQLLDILNSTVHTYSEHKSGFDIPELNKEAVYTLTITLDGKYIVAGNYAGKLLCWNLQTGVKHCTLPELQLQEQEFAYQFQRADYNTPVTMNAHLDKISAIVQIPTDSRYLFVTASLDCTIKIWDLEKKYLLASFTGDNPFFCCKITPDGKTIIAGDSSGQVHFFQIEGLEAVDEFFLLKAQC